MFLIIAVILQVVLIYYNYALNSEFSDAMGVTKMSDIDNKKKETTQFFGDKNRLPIKGLKVNTPRFNVRIPVNTDVNILETVGLNNCLWIVDNVFELNICGKKVDISNFCSIGASRTIVFFIGENNKFILSIDFDSGKTIIKTNSKEFESEIAVLTFEAKHIKTPKNFYGRATLELARMAQKKREEFENNKIGDDNV